MFYGADNKKLSAKMSSLENVQSLQNKLFMLNLLTASQLSKSLSAFTSQLEPQNVVRFFKCMESSCDFCTDEEDKFKDHLRAHVDPPHCTYCNELAANERLLVEHMLAEHGSCRFQCALCFYRSQTVTHMRVHGIMVHNSKAVFWYACTEKVPTSPKLVGHGKDHIGGYVCKDCSFRSHCTEHFFEHLSVIHSGPFTVSCHICCAQVGGPNSLIDHYTEMHNIRAFHCLYCDFGSQFDWDVIVHMTMCHPGRPFKIFCRGKDMPSSFRTLKELERSNVKDGIPASFSCFSPHDSLKGKWQQEDEGKKYSPDLNVNVKMPVKDDLEKCSNTEKCLFTPGFAMSETKCKCGATFNDIGMLFQHLTGEHAKEHCFDCPKCMQLTNASVGDLFAHIVDSHTAFFRCCYKKCFFIGESGQSVDDHVMQAHQHFDLPKEDATEAHHNVTCVNNESDTRHPGNLSKVNNVAAFPEEPRERNDDWSLLESGVVYSCTLCCQNEMQPLDYFRHMSLGHGIKFFCGHCKKGYKLWKQMRMHHSRCHSESQLSVKSFEKNELKDVTSELQSDCNNEGQGGVDSKLAKSKDAEVKDAGNALKGALATKTSKEGFNETAARSATRIDSGKLHVSSLSTALHYSRTHKKTLPSSSEEPKRVTDKFGLLQPTPLGKKYATCSQQKKCQPGHSSAAGQQKNECSHTGPGSSRKAPESPSSSRTSVPQTDVRKSPPASCAHPKKGLPKENEGKAHQPKNDCKPSLFCGHCLRGYRLLKPLVTHQKTVHPELPLAIRKLHMEKLEDITNDDAVKKYEHMGTAKSVQPDDCDPVVEEEASEVSRCDYINDADYEQSSSENERAPKVKHKWRRIQLISSDSEDDEDPNASKVSCHDEGFSYYGKPVEPIDVNNIYVRFYEGDFRIVFCQLARIVNVSPIVLVRKEIVM
uniref:C2H2-type domain-containing protein n=1 Tax=Rhipicephalus appendiculatus TaxID=34631 RepID=A0A131Z1E9_RHIAP